MSIRLRKPGPAGETEAATKSDVGRMVGHRQFLKMLAGAAGVAGVAQLAMPRSVQATYTPGPPDVVNTDLTMQGNLTIQGGLLEMTNGTANLVKFASVAYSPPTTSPGWKVKLWENPSLADCLGVGVEACAVWVHTYTSLKLYARGSLILTADNTSGGRLTLGSRVVADTAGCYYA